MLQIGSYMMNPFNHALVSRKELKLVQNDVTVSGFMKFFNGIARVLYFIPGLLSVIAIILTTISCFISIIGIPVGLVYARAISAFFNPVDKVCVPREVANQIEAFKTRAIVSKQSQVVAYDQDSQKEYVDLVKNKSIDELKELARQKKLINPNYAVIIEKAIYLHAMDIELTYEAFDINNSEEPNQAPIEATSSLGYSPSVVIDAMKRGIIKFYPLLILLISGLLFNIALIIYPYILDANISLTIDLALSAVGIISLIMLAILVPRKYIAPILGYTLCFIASAMWAYRMYLLYTFNFDIPVDTLLDEHQLHIIATLINIVGFIISILYSIKINKLVMFGFIALAVPFLFSNLTYHGLIRTDIIDYNMLAFNIISTMQSVIFYATLIVGYLLIAAGLQLNLDKR